MIFYQWLGVTADRLCDDQSRDVTLDSNLRQHRSELVVYEVLKLAEDARIMVNANRSMKGTRHGTW